MNSPDRSTVALVSPADRRVTAYGSLVPLLPHFQLLPSPFSRGLSLSALCVVSCIQCSCVRGTWKANKKEATVTGRGVSPGRSTAFLYKSLEGRKDEERTSASTTSLSLLLSSSSNFFPLPNSNAVLSPRCAPVTHLDCTSRKV